jgi:hypothetical protein
VIISHGSFKFLPVSDRLFNRFVDEQLEDAIMEAQAGQSLLAMWAMARWLPEAKW